jgi:predicted transcriptional regulator
VLDKIFTDGVDGFVKRTRALAKSLDEGRTIAPSHELTFESAAEMARLLTPARLDLLENVRRQSADGAVL